MDRHSLSFLSIFIIVFLVTVYHSATAALPRQPNIVVILTDDQRWDTLWAMPNLQSRLVNNGVSFSNAFITTPLCCPYRASTLSGGYYAHNTGVLTNSWPNGGAPAFDDSDTIATRLQQAGYTTALVGKYFSSYKSISPRIPPGWSYFSATITSLTSADTSLWSNFTVTTGSSGSNSATTGTVQGPILQHITDYEKEHALEFLDQFGSQPFFLYFSTEAPHWPAPAAPGDGSLFNDYTYNGRGFGEEDLSDKPQWVRDEAFTVGGGNQLARSQLRALQSVDRAIAAIVDKVEQLGQLDQTIFIFTSDSGHLWGEHRLLKKGVPYEEVIRVPLIITAPGLLPKSIDQLVAVNLDLGPTLFELAGISKQTDGTSLIPLLEETATTWRNEVFLENFRAQNGQYLTWAGLRTGAGTGEWKYVEYETGEGELYDLSNDPYELANLFTNPAYQDTALYLSTLLDSKKGLAIVGFEAAGEFGIVPNAEVGKTFKYNLNAWGGTPPYHWEIVSGTLPAGLVFDQTTGAISGTPLTTGSVQLRIKVTDMSTTTRSGDPQSFIQNFTFTVNAPHIAFEEVTGPAGVAHISPSFGASWGDYNGDGWPDLWVGNHYSTPTLYLNNRNGTFADVTETYWTPNLIPDNADTHGAAWGDFDNDGDQDLVEVSGGGGGRGYTNPNHYNHLFINEADTFTDQAESLGIRYPLARGRTPLWLDRGSDGLLDLALLGITRSDGEGPSALFEQIDGSFVETNTVTGFSLPVNSEFGHLSDFNNDGHLDLICQGNPYPQKVYDLTTLPLTDITTDIIATRTYATDVAVADFNGDLLPDIYLARNGDPTGVIQEDANTIKTRLKVSKDEKGLSFNASGQVTFDLYPPWMKTSDIYIGSTGYNPTSFNFTLSPDETSVQGILPHIGGADRGIYVGFDPETSLWQILISSTTQGTGADDNVNAIITSSISITNLSTIGFNPVFVPMNDKLWLNTGGSFIDNSSVSGLNNALACDSVVSGDFDNDMDVDLYLTCTGPVANLPNILYENQGDGTFVQVEGAGGAAGSSIGRGENVAVADFNRDGFLDLFVTNGKGPEPFHNGPHQLYHNTGNSNHWLEIDLEGISVNRDGIGAKLYATTNGITQLREQGGGMHRFAQNHQRIHFGLGPNSKVDSLIIEWPNGKTQTLTNIPANQIIKVTEPSGTFVPGKPIYTAGVESGAFLWKETFDGPYHLRTIGSGTLTDFEIKLVATEAIYAAPVKIEVGDTFEEYPYGFRLTSRLTAWEDGVDFTLPPGAEGMLSITQDTRANPRQFFVGADRARQQPTGWILRSDTLPARPAFQPAEELGLFVGNNGAATELRWNGDSINHHAQLSVIGASPFAAWTAVNFETNDSLESGSNWIETLGWIGRGWDGIDLSFNQPTELGISYHQDQNIALFAANPDTNSLGLPNAYQLPRPLPYGQPAYDPATEAGIFLWKDEANVWHLRATAGGIYAQYTGSIVSDQPIDSITAVGLEPSDSLDISNPQNIHFSMEMAKVWEDGIDLKYPPGTTLWINLDFPVTNPQEVVKIGQQKWSISALPLELRTW